MAKMVKFLNRLVRWLWLVIALLIIGTVILVVIGRQTISGIDHYRGDIQKIIQQQIGLRVELGQLNGEWPRLVPVLDIEQATIFAEGETTAVVINGGRADLDLFETIVHRIPIWRELAVDSLQLTLAEDENGQWGLKGFAGNADADLSLFVDTLSYSQLIRFGDVEIVLEFFSGKSMLLSGRDMAMENDDDFHRAELSVILSDQNTAEEEDSSADYAPAYLLIEGYGDLSDVETFFAEGYFRFDDFNLSEPLADLARSLLPTLFANLSDFDANANGDIWFTVQPGGSTDFEGRVAIGEVPLNWLADVPPLTDIEAEVTGWFTPASDWGIRLQGFDLNWADTDIEPLDLVFTQRLGSHWKDFDVSVNHLDLSLLSELLAKTQIADEKVLNAFDNLQPRGSISALTLGHDHVGYYASANLEKLSLSSWNGSPGVKSLDGYVEIYGDRGLFSFADNDGFEAYFPSAYKDYLTIDQATGSVNVSWEADKNMLTVRSNSIRTQLDAGSSNILFSAQQTIPANGSPPDVTLMIGARNLDASKRKKYLPKNIPERLDRWLEEAIVDIQVEEFGLLLRNSPPKFDRSSRTSQLMFKTSGGVINYDPNWTGIRDAESYLLVDDGYSEVTLSYGTIGTAQVSDASVIYSNENPDSQPYLYVDAKVDGPLSEVINILANSPVKGNVAGISDWNYSGGASSQLDLVIPMASSSKSPELKSRTQYNVSTTISAGSVAIPDGPISMTDIEGQVDFSLEQGLVGNNVRGNFWQRPMVINLSREGGEQKIALSGDLLPESLNQLVEFPWQEVVKGVVPIEGLITIPTAKQHPITLDIRSQLQDVSLELPTPLYKSAEESQSLDIRFYFAPDFERLTATLAPVEQLNPELKFDLHFDRGLFVAGQVSYDREMIEPERGILRLSSYLATTELELWQPLLDLFERQADIEATQPNWKTVFDLQFGQLEQFGYQLKDIAAVATLFEETVNIDLRSDLVDGKLQIPLNGSSQIPKINLSRLSLPKALLEEKVSGSTIDPRQFLALDIAIGQLMIGEENWGSLAFELRPEVSGAAFNRIEGNLFGLKPGALENQPATEFFWQYDGSRYSSRLVGPVAVDNIGDFLVSGLDVPQIVDSQSGQMIFDLAWDDQPWKISRENISGDFAIKLNDGSFYKSPGGSGAALKMVSLVNFANWLRRLKLDFSDVVGQNLAYNSLHGTLHFENGIASLRDPLRMNMPSGRMSMAGDFDMLNEQVDGRLVATLPVATNLPWVVALMGGLPAAAGVYVTSKLVEKQVDRLSSISYELSGSWDDIDVEVDRIFAPDLLENNQQKKAKESAVKSQEQEADEKNSEPKQQ